METFDYKSSTAVTKSTYRKTSKDIKASEKNDGEKEENGKLSNLTKTANDLSVLRDITNSRMVEEEGKSKYRNSRWKKEVARERWKILAKALLKSMKSPGKGCKLKEISVRRFTTFDLVTPSKLVQNSLKEISERTDYWVSQGRKFCEFCKCSIADNKLSIQVHENGKKHKESVAKRLTEMQKKAAKEVKDAVNFEKEMKRMEAAALKAYKNDMQSNADYTSQLIQKGLETLPEPEVVEPEPMKPKFSVRKSEKKPLAVQKKWMEAVTEDGRTYYWNVDTRESVWETPATGYLSLAEQKKQKTNKPFKGTPKSGKKHKKHIKSGTTKPKSKPTESKADEKKEAKADFGPLPYTPPFGKWEKVEPPKEQKIDLQLPQQEWVEITVPKIKEEGERVFKEKTSSPGFVSSSRGEFGFKKRKIAADAKRNMRQRLDDD